jgi:hypothetical protein
MTLLIYFESFSLFPILRAQVICSISKDGTKVFGKSFTGKFFAWKCFASPSSFQKNIWKVDISTFCLLLEAENSSPECSSPGVSAPDNNSSLPFFFSKKQINLRRFILRNYFLKNLSQNISKVERKIIR